MYKELVNIHEKPSPFSKYTAKQLWTEPYLANQMLQAHLCQETPMASRPLIAIERVVNWLDSKFKLNGKSVCDLGCGPGLYAEKYATLGAKVVGLLRNQLLAHTIWEIFGLKNFIMSSIMLLVIKMSKYHLITTPLLRITEHGICITGCNTLLTKVFKMS